MLLGIFLLAPTDSITIYRNEKVAEAVIDLGIDENEDPEVRPPTFRRLTQRRRSSVIGAHLHIGGHHHGAAAPGATHHDQLGRHAGDGREECAQLAMGRARRRRPALAGHR